jgi:hypothetical protein
LRSIETFPQQEVTPAVEQTLQLRTISYDAVKHLLLDRIERRPPGVDMENIRIYP